MFKEVLGDPLPPGWHEVHGETGKTALLWSLCRARPPDRMTVVVQTGEPYDYRQVAQWTGIPEDEVLIVETRQDLLSVLLDLCESGDIGQVILEGLGFLLGSGRLLPEVETLLGDVSGFFTLDQIAKEKDIALYTSSYPISDFLSPPGVGRERVLGGRLLSELCNGRCLEARRVNYLARYGERIGERLRVTNVSTGASCLCDIHYERGPVRVRC